MGDSSSRLATGTMSALLAAASMAERSASNSAVVVASVWMRAAPEVVCTHQASAVRRIEMVITAFFFLWVGFGWLGVAYGEQPAQGGQVEFVVVAQRVEHQANFARGFARR